MKRKFPSFREFLRTNGKILLESEEVLSEFEKEFPREIVRADPSERPLEVTEENMRKIFDILNKMIFNGKLANIELHSFDNSESIRFLKTYNKDVSIDEMKIHLAFHILQPYEGIGINRHKYIKTDREAIVFNKSYGNSSFGYAVGSICHEMVHMYDYLKGDALKRGYAFNEYGIPFNEHTSPIFKSFMDKVRENYDIPIMTDGEGHSYFELNKEAQEFFLRLKETMLSLDESKSKQSDFASVTDNGDGSFVIVGFFDAN